MDGLPIFYGSADRNLNVVYRHPDLGQNLWAVVVENPVDEDRYFRVYAICANVAS